MTQSHEIFASLPPSTTIPLPAEKRPQTGPLPASGQLRVVLLLILSLLAFLLASFPAQNTDLWVHLARGRLLAQGKFTAAVNPAYASDLPSNQTWLYDSFCYACHQALGGPALVVCKALLAVVLAWLIFRLCRSDEAWGVPAVCTMLAVLALSVRLLLQPATVSFVFLALALFLLRFRREPEERPLSFVPTLPLFALFLVWANVDHWFTLGLAVVALVRIGETIDVGLSARSDAERWRSLLVRCIFELLALGGACLLNPAHANAFVLPGELEGYSAGQVTSPFQKIYFLRFGRSPAAWAYFALLILSLLSFVLNRSHWSWRRFVPWAGLALLSAIQMRTIPFFAIVAAPVLAWNVQEILALAFQRGRYREDELIRFGRTCAVFLGAILLVCAWPGWLRIPPFEPRRWDVDLPLSLERGAEEVGRWHQGGKLALQDVGLHLSAESLRAFAWFCPQAKEKLIDGRVPVEDWPRYMRHRGMNHLVLFNDERQTLLPALVNLFADPEQWPLLYQRGSLAIFGWRDPEDAEAAKRFRDWGYNFDHAAFHPGKTGKSSHTSADAEERSWWEAFWKPTPPPSLHREDAAMFVLEAEAYQRLAPVRHFLHWQLTESAALIGALGSWSSPAHFCYLTWGMTLLQPPLPAADADAERPSPLTQLVWFLQKRSTMQQSDVPPALYYLAVRSARRALDDNPEDALTYLHLGESYFGLLSATQERVWMGRLRGLTQLRQVQASTALNRAVSLNPNLTRAQLLLGQLYRQMGYNDLALKHLQIYARLSKAGRPAGVEPDQWEAQQKQIQEELSKLQNMVDRYDDEFTLKASGAAVRDRALMASRLGLVGKALEVLLESHLSAFGPEGLHLQLELMLGTGRAKDVRDWLAPEHEADLGPLNYHWILARALAALGNYAQAEEECAAVAQALTIQPNNPEPLRPRQSIALLVGQVMLNEQKADAALIPHVRAYNRVSLMRNLVGMSEIVRQQTDKYVLRGLIALEEGDVDEAEIAFRGALSVWKSETAAASGAGLDFGSRPIAQTCLQWMQ